MFPFGIQIVDDSFCRKLGAVKIRYSYPKETIYDRFGDCAGLGKGEAKE